MKGYGVSLKGTSRSCQQIYLRQTRNENFELFFENHKKALQKFEKSFSRAFSSFKNLEVSFQSTMSSTHSIIGLDVFLSAHGKPPDSR